MKITAKTIEEYFTAAETRGADLRQVHDLIRQEVPELTPYLFDGMSISMIGYGTMHYRTKSGLENDWPIIGLAIQKNYISLYICLVKEGEYLAEVYSKKLGKVNCGKSCVRFKKAADLNFDAVKILLKEASEISKDPSNYQF